MNEEYIKEYEEMSLCDFADELVEPLSTIKKDLTKIIYIHYAKERDKNYKLEEEKHKLILDSNGLINANGILQQENFELKENYKAILKQRDDTNKSAVETIEKYQQENARLKDNCKQLEKFICYEKDRLLKATSHTYQDSFDKIKLVNSDIFEELKKVENKMKELFKEN